MRLISSIHMIQVCKSGPSWRWFQSSIASLLGAFLILAAGCGRESGARTGGEQPPGNAETGVPQPKLEPSAHPRALEVQPDADPAAVIEELNRELRRYRVTYQRLPANFEEFVATTRLQVPPPPPGKKYIINRQNRVELVRK
jgi:hypothetical protein